MLELLSRLSPSDLAVVLLVPAVTLVAGVIIISALIIRAVQRNRERETAAAVVAEMLDRGIATEEIIAVLKAMGLEGSPDPRLTTLRQRRDALLKRVTSSTA
ncbi:MAG: hypothetical protein GXX96_15545 [Planctomycetaceae bacterium]|jgi:hypothetical protein|nr:hypothetical protein [Planctomycetaceae bacterium]